MCNETEINPQQGDKLRQSWSAFRKHNPKMRIRDAAQQLGTSEAQLLATGCGRTVTRLQDTSGDRDWINIIQSLPLLGEVLALTRNEYAVHEKTGSYENVEVYSEHGMGAVFGEAIDLRLFLEHWQLGFAATQPTKNGQRQSLQFFDSQGCAVHKVYLTPNSSASAYEELVVRFTSSDQSLDQDVQAISTTPSPHHDEEIDIVALRKAWHGMQNTHDFFPLLKKFGLQRLQALRLAGLDLACQVSSQAHRQVMEAVRDIELPINETGIDSSWVVRKPTTEGEITALELYDSNGQQIIQLFSKRLPGESESQTWRQILNELTSLASC